MKKINLVIGICLIVLAVILLAINWGSNPLSLAVIWPIFPFLIGILFFSFYFVGERQAGFLMPGVILFLTGIVFFVCTLTTWDNMRFLWPVFILAPGIGFFLNYFAGLKEKFHLIWGTVLTFVALIFLLIRSRLEVLWPILLLIIGLVFIFIYMSQKPGNGEQKTVAEGEEKTAKS